MTRSFFTLSAILLSIPAAGDVQLWSGDPNDVTIVDDDVQILAPGTFKFESVDGSGNLDVIGQITVANGVTDMVTVYIERSTDNNMPGATSVGAINLTNNMGSSLTGELKELRITGDLGTSGATVVRTLTGPAVFQDTPNNISILSNVSSLGQINAGEVGDITIGNDLIGAITAEQAGNITITRFFSGSITADTLGDVDVQATFSTLAGAITVHGAHAGDITLGTGATTDVHIEGDYSGVFSAAVHFMGTIEIDGDLEAPGRIVVTRQVDNDENTPIHIHGSITGSASAPLIDIGESTITGHGLNGTIAVDGSLTNANTSGPEIQIDGDLDTLGAIAINYDGDPGAGDEWPAAPRLLWTAKPTTARMAITPPTACGTSAPARAT